MNIKKSLLSLLTVSLTVTACNSNINNNIPPQTQNVFATANNMPVVEIQLKNQEELSSLSEKGFDLFGFDARRKSIRARVNSTEQKFLKDNKYRFANIREKNMTSSGLLSGYSTYQEMKTKLQELAKQYPNIATLQDIGDTWEKTAGQSPDHDVWCMTITNKQKRTNKPASLFVGGMHARELAPVEIMLKLTEHLLSQYGKDPQITQLVDTRDINIVPMVNVDGRVQVEKGDNWQRKNTHGNGVDLNRNFDSHWNYQGLDVPPSWSSGMKNPRSETYSGSAPASEPETQAIQNFYKQKKLNLVLDMHSYGEMFFWPVGYSEEPVPEINVFKNIYNNSFKKIGFSGGSSATLLYPTTGTTDDYAYVKHHALGLGMEIGRSFRPSYSEVERMWTELKPNLLYLIQVSNTTLNGRR